MPRIKMEWMRCNACWIKAEGSQCLFHLSECGHMYCDNCLRKAGEKCIHCNSDTNSLPLTEPLHPQLAHYFTQPKDLLEKVIEAQQFQEFQFALCIKHTDASDSKLQSLKEAHWESTENFKKLLDKYNKLKLTVNLKLKEKKKSLITSGMYTPSHFRTPPSEGNNPKYGQPYFCPNTATNSATGNNGVFRVPSVTRAPRSATPRHSAASSISNSSSHCRMATTSQSNPATGNNGIFRVPSVTRAPRSATPRHSDASSISNNSSHCRMAATPQSNYSRYRN